MFLEDLKQRKKENEHSEKALPLPEILHVFLEDLKKRKETKMNIQKIALPLPEISSLHPPPSSSSNKTKPNKQKTKQQHPPPPKKKTKQTKHNSKKNNNMGLQLKYYTRYLCILLVYFLV